MVAIIGILAAVALPAYQTCSVRAELSEGLVVAISARTTISEGFQADGMNGLAAGVAAINMELKNSKYVSASGLTGNQTFVLAPGIRTGVGAAVPLAAGLAGSIDWAVRAWGKSSPDSGDRPVDRHGPDALRAQRVPLKASLRTDALM